MDWCVGIPTPRFSPRVEYSLNELDVSLSELVSALDLWWSDTLARSIVRDVRSTGTESYRSARQHIVIIAPKAGSEAEA